LVHINQPSRQLALLRGDILQALSEVADSGRWIKGERTSAFEHAFAGFCGVSHCLGVANGTDALELALRALESAGKEVITVANAGGYTTTACRLVGAKPVYVDVEEDSLLLDLDAAIHALTRQTRAIVVTHLYGSAVDVEDLRGRLHKAQRDDVMIIEDCAQAHGACVRGRRVGSLGDLGTFSFYPTKNLGALGDAGAIVCADEVLFEEVVALHQYGWVRRYESQLPYGRNSRMDEMQAAVLLVKLPYLDQWNDQRRAIVRGYQEAVQGSGTRLAVKDAPECVAHLAVIRTRAREAFRKGFEQRGIMTDVHYPKLDCDQASQRNLPMDVRGLAVSRQQTNEILTLPCFPELTSGERSTVADALHELAMREKSPRCE